MAADVRFGHLPAYDKAIFPSPCAALIGGAVAASAGARVRDDHVAEDAPIVHALPVEVRVAFQNRIVLDCAGYAIGNMRCLMSLGPVGAVAGLVDFQPV